MFIKLLTMFLKTLKKAYSQELSEPVIAHESNIQLVQFGRRSQERLSRAHPNLQRLAIEILQEMDITVLCTYRGEKEQNEAFRAGNSTLKYPQSKHNKLPSLAIDIAPYPVNWNDIEAFNKMCDIALEKAQKLGIKIRLGRSFSFKDYPHIELI